MAGPNIADLATSLVVTAPSPASSGTALSITSGDSSLFPAVPFNVIAHPANELPTVDNAEILLVTANTSGAFTITRSQGVSSSKSIAVGWRISVTVFSAHITGAYDRANHIGSQAISTVTGLQTALSGIVTTPSIPQYSSDPNTPSLVAGDVWVKYTAASGGGQAIGLLLALTTPGSGSASYDLSYYTGESTIKRVTLT